mmetsp:Transcript_41800/g.67801  ORF Transcript_41800/g.67801 Transcript_41800/m.67801 type:complete len:210 (-) Transcript_41800:1095-1724(-)
MTCPFSVNLHALCTRFIRICRSRVGSPIRMEGISGGMTHTTSIPLKLADANSISTISSARVRRSNSTLSRRSMPASIFEISRRSFSVASSWSQQRRIASKHSNWFASTLVSRRCTSIPIIPFKGVLTSWQTKAINLFLATAAASISIIWRFSVMSCAIHRRPTIFPSESLLGIVFMRTTMGCSFPSTTLKLCNSELMVFPPFKTGERVS